MPAAINCKFLNKQTKGNPMKHKTEQDEFIYPPPIHQVHSGESSLAELQKIGQNILQRLDMLVDLQHLVLQELKNQAKEKD